ncbi:MAG: LysR family transcriptional regulator, partial [Clostridia bacterium]|nr:LysR family transcriptional regulator [Clostridia bacterium]
MELLQLKYFCDAASTENFSRTAKKYNVPPSNISQSIKRLEKELGVNLFNRKSNSLVLNQQGKLFYNKMNHALNLIDEAKNEITDNEFNAQLRICIMTNRHIAMNVIEKFRTQYPEVVIMSDYSLQENYEEYDIILADDSFNPVGMKREPIIREEIALAVNTKNPLSKKGNITAEDLKNQDFIFMNKGSSMYDIAHKICNTLKIEPNVVIQSPDPAFIRKCVDLNLGITFVPTTSWEGQFSEDVTIKKLDGLY